MSEGFFDSAIDFGGCGVDGCWEIAVAELRPEIEDARVPCFEHFAVLGRGFGAGAEDVAPFGGHGENEGAVA